MQYKENKRASNNSDRAKLICTKITPNSDPNSDSYSMEVIMIASDEMPRMDAVYVRVRVQL
jgi:hypothetical protein